MFASVDEFTIRIQGDRRSRGPPGVVDRPDIGCGAGSEWALHQIVGRNVGSIGGGGAEHRDDKGRDGVQHNP